MNEHMILTFGSRCLQHNYDLDRSGQAGISWCLLNE
jgi:hypothetical protein